MTKSSLPCLALCALGLAAASTVQLRASWLEITVGSGEFSVLDHGAKGDGKTDDTEAVEAAFAAAKKAKGGTVLFPAGKTYLTSAFSFQSSNTVMKVPLGARVVFSDNFKLYSNETKAFINAESLNNIGIVGGGLVDGKGKKWWDCKDRSCQCSSWDGSIASGCRPKMLNVGKITKMLIEGVTFKDSPNHVLEVGADYAELSHVNVFNPPSTTADIPVNGTYGESHNTDAVDVHGTPFYVHHCNFDTGDDNLAVHASHVLVEECYLGNGHGASIGSVGSDKSLENITFRNLVFNNSGAGAKIKTHAGATNTYIKDVTWENMVHYNVQESIVIDMFYDHGKNESTDVRISNITIRNLTMHGTKTQTGKTVIPGYFHCQESSPCHGIHLEQITSLDSQVQFDCYNAFGDWDQTSPTPCLKKESARRRSGLVI